MLACSYHRYGHHRICYHFRHHEVQDRKRLRNHCVQQDYFEKLKIAHIDIASLCLSFSFMIIFVALYHLFAVMK